MSRRLTTSPLRRLTVYSSSGSLRSSPCHFVSEVSVRYAVESRAHAFNYAESTNVMRSDTFSARAGYESDPFIMLGLTD